MIDKKYWAGFFDGEGSIVLHRKSNQSVLSITYDLRCSIGQSGNFGKSILTALQNQYGGSCLLEKRCGEKRQYYKWVISANKAQKFLQSIEPYLLNKHRQAVCALEFCELKNHHTRGWHISDDLRLSIACLSETFQNEIQWLNAHP